MIRHVIPNSPGSPECRKTVVGWDGPLNTFFATVTDVVPEPDEDDFEEEVVVFSVGDTPCELPTIGDLARALAEHGVELSLEVAAKLGEDYFRVGKRFAGRPASGLLAAMSASYAGPEQAQRISAALTGQDQTGGA